MPLVISLKVGKYIPGNTAFVKCGDAVLQVIAVKTERGRVHLVFDGPEDFQVRRSESERRQ